MGQWRQKLTNRMGVYRGRLQRQAQYEDVESEEDAGSAVY